MFTLNHFFLFILFFSFYFPSLSVFFKFRTILLLVVLRCMCLGISFMLVFFALWVVFWKYLYWFVNDVKSNAKKRLSKWDTATQLGWRLRVYINLVYWQIYLNAGVYFTQILWTAFVPFDWIGKTTVSICYFNDI